jgi:hypothetical protein
MNKKVKLPVIPFIPTNFFIFNKDRRIFSTDHTVLKFAGLGPIDGKFTIYNPVSKRTCKYKFSSKENGYDLYLPEEGIGTGTKIYIFHK